MPDAGTQRTTKARARVQALLRAFNNHDIDKIVAMHAADAEWEDPTLAAPAKGHDAIRQQLTRMFRAFPDLHFVMDELDVYSAGLDRLAARWHAMATMSGPMDPPGFAPTGKRTEFSGACFYHFHDGLLTHHAIVFDTMGMLEQLGVMPPPGSAMSRLTVGLQRAVAEVGRRLPR